MSDSAFVLDSWAIMEWQKGQPCAGQVRAHLESSLRGNERLYISIVNLGEIFYLTAKAQNKSYAQRLLTRLRRVYKVQTVPAPDEFVMAAARLKADYPISYADAFAAHTAISLQLALITGDPELDEVHERMGLELVWLGGQAYHQ